MVTERRAGSGRAALVVFTAYAALTGVVYWPVVADPRSRILADSHDGTFFLWNLWWLPRTLLQGENPFHSGAVFHPVGANLAFNIILAPVGLVSWPVQKLLGLAVAANAVQLGAVVLTAVGTYLLARQVGAARLPSFVAGAAFAFTPYRIFQAPGHWNLNHTELLVFGLWALLRVYERPTRGRAAVLGVLLALTGWSDGYYSVFLGFAVVAVAVWRWRETIQAAVARRLGLAVLLAALLTAPLLAAMANDLRQGELDPIPGWGGSDVYSADLMSWITPQRDRRFLPDMLTSVDPILFVGERTVFPTWTLMIAGLAGAIWGPRRRRGMWIFLAGTFFVLSLGPFLQANGWRGGAFTRFDTDFSVPLPGMVLGWVPVVNGVRDPARFAVMSVLALAVLAAFALTRLHARHRAVGTIITLAVAGLSLAESLPSHTHTFVSAIPRPYDAMAADRGDGAVLEIPLQWRTGFGVYGDTDGDHTRFLYYATRHGKPMVNGMMPRYRQAKLDRLLRVPVYDQMQGLLPGFAAGVVESVPAGRPPGEPHPPPTFTSADLRALGIGYVVYHRNVPRPEAAAYIEKLDLPVLADDGNVIVWKVT